MLPQSRPRPWRQADRKPPSPEGRRHTDQLGCEGIVSKRLGSPYCSGRSRTPDELARLSLTKEQIGLQLRNYYRACTAEELPPRLLTLLKKLDPELPAEQDQ
jgi:hypothetical protein